MHDAHRSRPLGAAYGLVCQALDRVAQLTRRIAAAAADGAERSEADALLTEVDALLTTLMDEHLAPARRLLEQEIAPGEDHDTPRQSG